MSRKVHTEQHLLMLSAPGSMYLQKGGRKHHSPLEAVRAAAAVCWEHPVSSHSLKGRCNTAQITNLYSPQCLKLWYQRPLHFSLDSMCPEHRVCMSLRSQWDNSFAISLNIFDSLLLLLMMTFLNSLLFFILSITISFIPLVPRILRGRRVWAEWRNVL